MVAFELEDAQPSRSSAAAHPRSLRGHQGNRSGSPGRPAFRVSRFAWCCGTTGILVLLVGGMVTLLVREDETVGHPPHGVTAEYVAPTQTPLTNTPEGGSQGGGGGGADQRGAPNILSGPVDGWAKKEDEIVDSFEKVAGLAANEQLVDAVDNLERDQKRIEGASPEKARKIVLRRIGNLVEGIGQDAETKQHARNVSHVIKQLAASGSANGQAVEKIIQAPPNGTGATESSTAAGGGVNPGRGVPEEQHAAAGGQLGQLTEDARKAWDQAAPELAEQMKQRLDGVRQAGPELAGQAGEIVGHLQHDLVGLQVARPKLAEQLQQKLMGVQDANPELVAQLEKQLVAGLGAKPELAQEIQQRMADPELRRAVQAGVERGQQQLLGMELEHLADVANKAWDQRDANLANVGQKALDQADPELAEQMKQRLDAVRQAGPELAGQAGEIAGRLQQELVGLQEARPELAEKLQKQLESVQDARPELAGQLEKQLAAGLGAKPELAQEILQQLANPEIRRAVQARVERELQQLVGMEHAGTTPQTQQLAAPFRGSGALEAGAAGGGKLEHLADVANKAWDQAAPELAEQMRQRLDGVRQAVPELAGQAGEIAGRFQQELVGLQEARPELAEKLQKQLEGVQDARPELAGQIEQQLAAGLGAEPELAEKIQQQMTNPELRRVAQAGAERVQQQLGGMEQAKLQPAERHAGTSRLTLSEAAEQLKQLRSWRS